VPHQDSCRQLRAGAGTKHDRATIHDVIDGEDVGLPGHVDGETPDGVGLEKLPAGGFIEGLGEIAMRVHVSITPNSAVPYQGRTSRCSVSPTDDDLEPPEVRLPMPRSTHDEPMLRIPVTT
jgi:hypothetical protein